MLNFDLMLVSSCDWLILFLVIRWPPSCRSAFRCLEVVWKMIGCRLRRTWTECLYFLPEHARSTTTTSFVLWFRHPNKSSHFIYASTISSLECSTYKKTAVDFVHTFCFVRHVYSFECTVMIELECTDVRQTHTIYERILISKIKPYFKFCSHLWRI